MARRGILDYVLGGAVGGLEGLSQQRAAEDEKKRLVDALTRQQGMDEENRQTRLAELMSQGFEPVSDVRRKQQDSVGAAGSLIGSALNAASGNAGMPMPSANAQAALAGGYANAQPSRTITFGGQELALRETPAERQERLSRVSASMARAEKEQEKRDRAVETQRAAEAKQADMTAMKTAWQSAGLSPAKADIAARTGAKYGDVMMSDKDMQALGISRAQLKLAQDRLAFEQTKASEPTQGAKDKAATLAAAKKAVTDVLPTVVDASNAVSRWGEAEVKSLSPFRIAAQNAAVLEGGLWGAVKSKALSKTGITDLDKQYLQYASAVADAVARASEVGVLTNQDINRFRSQVSFDGGENEAQIEFKLDNLKKWASWLANSKKNIDAADGSIDTPSSNYGSVSKIPGETDKEYESRTGKSASGANANPYR